MVLLIWSTLCHPGLWIKCCTVAPQRQFWYTQIKKKHIGRDYSFIRLCVYRKAHTLSVHYLSIQVSIANKIKTAHQQPDAMQIPTGRLKVQKGLVGNLAGQWELLTTHHRSLCMPGYGSWVQYDTIRMATRVLSRLFFKKSFKTSLQWRHGCLSMERH